MSPRTEARSAGDPGSTPESSENERALSAERPDAFRLFRLYDVARTPRAFELAPPLEHSVLLQPANWRASFG